MSVLVNGTLMGRALFSANAQGHLERLCFDTSSQVTGVMYMFNSPSTMAQLF